MDIDFKTWKTFTKNFYNHYKNNQRYKSISWEIMNLNYYEVLGASKNETTDEIKIIL